MKKISILIRKLTVPPVFAALLLIIISISRPYFLNSIWQFVLGILFLTVLPVLAYPMQKHFSSFKDKGREGQRSLAMLFSFAGYCLGVIVAFATSAPIELKIIYLEYLLCGLGMLVFNKVFKLKASGHACGIIGPVALLIYFRLYIPALVGIALSIPVYLSSVKTKRHTVPQLVGGSLIPAVVLCLIVLASKITLSL